MARWRRPIWQMPQVKVHHKLVLAVPHKTTFHKSRRRMFHFSIIFWNCLSLVWLDSVFFFWPPLRSPSCTVLRLSPRRCSRGPGCRNSQSSPWPVTPLTFLWGLLSQLCYCSTHWLNMVEPWSTILPLSIIIFTDQQAANKIKLIKQLTFWSNGRQISIPVSPLGRMEPLRHPAWAQHGCWLVSLGSSMWLCQMGPHLVQVIIKSLHQVDSLRDLRAFNDYSL